MSGPRKSGKKWDRSRGGKNVDQEHGTANGLSWQQIQSKGKGVVLPRNHPTRRFGVWEVEVQGENFHKRRKKIHRGLLGIRDTRIGLGIPRLTDGSNLKDNIHVLFFRPSQGASFCPFWICFWLSLPCWRAISHKSALSMCLDSPFQPNVGSQPLASIVSPSRVKPGIHNLTCGGKEIWGYTDRSVIPQF